MKSSSGAISIAASAQRLDVDNRISLHYYYRIADNLIKQYGFSSLFLNAQAHPMQSCFMSSIDLHTHYSYQIMLPEAIAIVMAPKDSSRTHGIFRLTSPRFISVIRQCQQCGFHPHEEPPDGVVYMTTAPMSI